MVKGKKTRILPSAREKKRYLAFEIKSNQKMTDFEPIFHAIYQRCLCFLGELGMSKANIYILKDKWNPNLQRGLIRVNHNHAQEVRAALTQLDEINGVSVSMKTIGMSGILKKAQEKYLR